MAERVPGGGDAQRLRHERCELSTSGRRRPPPSPGGGQAHLPGPGGGPQAKLYDGLLEQKFGRRPVLPGGGGEGRLPCLRYGEPPEGAAGDGHQFRQDPDHHLSGRGAAAPGLGKKRAAPDGPHQPGDPGQVGVCEPVARQRL